MQETYDSGVHHPEFVPEGGNVVKADFFSWLNQGIDKATRRLISNQNKTGYWCYELEADCTIPAEYVLMMHFMDERNETLEARLANYLRKHQGRDGGWPLFKGGSADLSCTVKVYYALKLAGDSPEAPHMRHARDLILSAGGAARANVFTRIALALFGQIPWRGVPYIPVEVMLLPRWFPFHVSKVSYWSRTVMVPLLILCALKPKARNPGNVHIQELFITPPDKERNYFPVRSTMNRLFLVLDHMGLLMQRLIPRKVRHRAIQRAEGWFTERLNGSGGLGAIFPAMVNAYEALDCLGYPANHPYRLIARQAIDELLVVHGDEAYCQPCVSPVWDTVLATLALQQVGGEAVQDSVDSALDWLYDRQLLEQPGDWRESHPSLPGGGWAFQFSNDYYPDLDDTGAVGWAMGSHEEPRYAQAIERAARWVAGMQSANNGFAAFDSDNTHFYLNEIPFADHGALLDPPTADVSARCAILLSYAGRQEARYLEIRDSVIGYLRNEQEPDGPWFGRWGTNYIYGTWSVLAAFEVCGVSAQDPAVQRAVTWLKNTQQAEGSWGETNQSYFDDHLRGQAESGSSFQTAWALLGLMAAGEVHSLEVRRGIEYLLQSQVLDGLWNDPGFNAPGFPRVFYLKYHGYSKYFPLWALARYRRLIGERD